MDDFSLTSDDGFFFLLLRGGRATLAKEVILVLNIEGWRGGHTASRTERCLVSRSLLGLAQCTACVMARLVLSIFAGTATSPSDRPFLPLVPRLLFLASLALVVDENLMNEIFDLLPLDFLGREVLTMVSVNCVSNVTYLSA